MKQRSKNSKNVISRSILFLLLIGSFYSSIAQKSLDDPFSKKKMQADLELFKSIRNAANSGVYKYRSQQQMDSIYQWATKQIQLSQTFRDFYNILWTITDYEGSLHNSLYLPPKVGANLIAESSGYFPTPLKLIQGNLLVNTDQSQLPLGAKILSVNGMSTEKLINTLGKYYATDGYNTTGKEIGISVNFSGYYRRAFGKNDSFQVDYREPGITEVQTLNLLGASYKSYKNAFASRHSKNFDSLSYGGRESTPYRFELVNELTGMLSISSFSIGWNENHPKHKAYVHFLDSIFGEINRSGIEHLIVDVRHNGGGSDPNDLVTYSYLTDRSFSENKEAWVLFKTPPYFKYNKEVSLIGKYLEKRAYKRMLKDDFPEVRDGKFYQDETSSDHLIRYPHSLAFNGNIYLLISPRTASAGSLFAAMVAGNKNTTVIGRETQGGYYGHNGHIPIRYRLPNSKIKFMFSIVNLEQDVEPKSNQLFGRGIMPDIEVEQSIEDFLQNRDTAMDFTLKLIQEEKAMDNPAFIKSH